MAGIYQYFLHVAECKFLAEEWDGKSGGKRKGMGGGERAQGLLKPPQNGDYQSNSNGSFIWGFNAVLTKPKQEWRLIWLHKNV